MLFSTLRDQDAEICRHARVIAGFHGSLFLWCVHSLINKNSIVVMNKRPDDLINGIAKNSGLSLK
jgi:hypothetical protein